MICSIVTNYLLGLSIEKCEEKKKSARILLIFSMVINLGLLLVFKYANFIVDNVNLILIGIDLAPIKLKPVHLPIGISFFTFQAITYVVDIYRRKISAQKNPINIGLYISLFPQLIAGPIVRYSDIAKQITNRTTSISGFAYGIERFILGFGKKILIANPLSEIADQIFDITGHNLTPGLAWLGVACYTLQIYYDFSGYSDMAIGLGRMFGFNIPENFNYPYISTSVREFWRRWHISLSNWFRDYLYIPLGGNRQGPVRTYINLLIVFVLCGLWHGPSWNFVIWGMIHGCFLVVERAGFINILRGWWRPLKNFYVMSVVMIAWVFFRTGTLPEALNYLSVMFGLYQTDSGGQSVFLFLNRIVLTTLIAGGVLSTPVFPYIMQFLERQTDRHLRISRPLHFYPAFYLFLLSIIFITSIIRFSSGAYNPFIYFRF